MPVLPYCIIAADADAAPATRGVRESAVESLIEDGLRCFYSVLSDLSLASAPDLKDAALRFDGLVRALLAETAVIPFRFPTMLATVEELREFMAENAARYSAALQRLGGVVQMELRIEHTRPSARADSGTGYLKARAVRAHALSEQADLVRASARDLIRDWRTRNVPRGLRCYVLVPRDRVAEFQARMGSLSTREDVKIVVSGPWPAAEFLDETTQG